MSGRVLMAAKRTRRKMNSKTQWTNKMNDDLLECKQKTLDLAKSSNPPRLDLGKKKRLHRGDEGSVGNEGILQARFVKSESPRPSSEAREDAR